jgi:hypothetical protein
MEAAKVRGRGTVVRASSFWLAWSLAALSVAMFVATFLLFGLARSAYASSRREVDLTVLRDETDLDHLSRDLVGVVRETVQPEHVSVWLRSPERKVNG